MQSINKIKYYDLTEPQKRIYFGENFFKGSSIGNLCASYYLQTDGSWDCLSEAINLVIMQNEGLRIQLSLVDGVPVQYVVPYKKISFIQKSIYNLKQWKREFSEKPFNLFDSPLYKIQIFYDENNHLSLIINMHHIISDAWTHDSLIKQIIKYYEELNNNETIIVEEKGSYLDYIDIEKEFLKSDRYEKSKVFWKNEINTNCFSPNINSKSEAKKSKASRSQFILDKEISDKINEFCSNFNISVPNFFFAILFIQSSKYTPNGNVVLGTLTHNRVGKKEKTVTGMYVNTLPVSMNIDKSLSFIEVLKNLTRTMAGVMRNQRFPLSDIKNCPELSIVYSYENVDLPIKIELHFSGDEFFPLIFRPSMRNRCGQYLIEIDYQVNIFNNKEIDSFFDNYKGLMCSFIEKSDAPLNSLYPLLSEKKLELDEIIKLQNKSTEKTLHRVFEKKVTEFAENKAISFNNTYITYYELNRRANFLATILLEKGAGNETPVVLILDRSLEMMISILAILKTGSCYLPLATNLPIARINKILDLSGASLLLFNNDLDPRISKKVICLDVNNINYPETYVPNLHIDIKPNNLAYIIYTSGSTGEPKGVMIEHRSVINRLFWMQDSYPLIESDVVMQKTPYTFDVSVWELFGWYLNGSSLHFLKPGAEKEPNTIVQVIKEERISIIHFVPSMLNLFLDYVEKYSSLEFIKSLRRVSCSGEALLLEHVNRFKKVISREIPIELYNLYGPTEATVEVSFYDCLKNEYDFIPIGKAINNVDLYVLNKKGEILPPGDIGELFIGGICLARGYFNKPELTNDKFKYNHIIGKRLYSTGDLATYLRDGNIKYLGRKDNQVKIRGNRVELGEIESCLLTIDGILEAAVIAPSDEYGNAYLGAYFVAEREIPHDDLRHYIQNELPNYMVPSYFIQMESFPLSASGKLDRKSLLNSENKEICNKKYHAPINDREEEICEIWEDVLKLEKISTDDNFFQIGGDSLSLIQVLFPLQSKYDVSLQDLFEHQTVKELSWHIHQRLNRKIEFKEDSYANIVNQRRCYEKIHKYINEINSEINLKDNCLKNILLTGSTGFLGAYLVKEYLEDSRNILYLLVRADSIEIAEKRVISKLEFYFGPELYKENRDRIYIICGDITKSYLGTTSEEYKILSTKVEIVTHCAANVKHYGQREDINKINVLGTQNVIRFCNEGLKKRINFISTISIGLNDVKQGTTYHFTENDLLCTNNKGNVYIDSKILAENIVSSAIPTLGGQILRVGNIVNDSKTGKFQENYKDNAFYSLMMEYKNRKIAPDIEIPFIDLSYVDQVANAIKLLSKSNYNGIFHIFNPHTITIKEFCSGEDLDFIEFKDYVLDISYGDSILTHGYYLHNVDLLGFIPYSDKTLKFLQKLGFQWGNTGVKEVRNLWNNWP